MREEDEINVPIALSAFRDKRTLGLDLISFIQGDPPKMPPTKMLITSTYVQRYTSYLVHINFSL